MADLNISVRQWKEMYKTGIFHQKDIRIPEEAGWDDFCDPLNNNGLQNLSKLVMTITHPFVLDNYHIFFMHHTPGTGPMYGSVHFNLLSEEENKKGFLVSLDSPHDRKKWALMTRRYGDGAPEFECDNIQSMSRYINNMAHELEQGIQPVFIAEKQAVLFYAIIHGEPAGVQVYREGNHQFSYISFQDERKRTVMAVSNLNEAPTGFVLDQAKQIKGIYVYCPNGNGAA